MKNTIFKLTEYVYYFSLLVLLILYLFPGSLIGYFLYGNLGQQPNLITNPIGTSINHFIAFFYLSFIGLISYLKDLKFKFIIFFLITISIALEFSHLLIPVRSFQTADLIGNLLGTFLAIAIILIYKRFKNGKI